MARDADLEVDPDWAAAVVSQPGIIPELVRRAEFGKVFAVQQAERYARDTGKFASSFEVKVERQSINRLSRPVAILRNTDPKAVFVEYGQRGHHILQRTVDVIKKAR